MSSALDSNLVTSHSVTLSSLASGTLYHFRVRSSNSAGVESSSGDASFSTSGGSTLADADFQQRCSTPGVVRCWNFDDSATTDTHVMPPYGQTQKLGVVDTTIKASGNGSLRFTIPSNSGSDTSGSFWLDFADDYSVQFGEGQEFYIQWRQRFSPEFLSTNYAGSEGWKQSITGEGDRPGFTANSCTQLEMVVQNTYLRGIPQMYHSCGEKDGQYEPLEVWSSTLNNWLLQNGVNC
jgi:hypothetical protein